MKKLSLLTLVAFISIVLFSSCKEKSKFNLKLDKKVYAPGDVIKVDFKASAEWDEYAWVGIIPSSVAHGKEAENDANDITYQYLNKKATGTLEFTAPSAPGKYDFRMNNADSGDDALEMASVSFEVK